MRGWSLAAAALVAATGAAESPPGLEEVEVTALRRAQPAERAALAVGVIPADALRNAAVVAPQDLTQLAPSLQVSASAAPISVYYLRGAGNFTGNALTDSAVSFNVDGVAIGRAHATSGFFHDLERVEVLKGPQGTLYGRNATGGAINLLPRRPVIGERSGEGSIDAGNRGYLRLDGVVNFPLGERAALRASGYRAERDGTMNDGLDDLDDAAGRLSLLVEPTDELSMRVVADYYDQGGRGPGSTPIDLGPGRRLGLSSAESAAYLESQRNAIAGRDFNAVPRTQHLDNRFQGVSATINWSPGAGTFTFLPAWREGRLDTVGTALGPTVTTIEDDRQASVEARYASDPEGRFSYIVGAYWFDETNRVPVFVPNTQYSMSLQDYDTGVESAAAFGRLSFDLTESLRATVGARYTHEDKFFRGRFEGAVRMCPPVPAASCPDAARFPVSQLETGLVFPPGSPSAIPVFNPADDTLTVGFRILADEEKSFSNWTWRAALEADLTERSFLYASVETGFKSGGFFFSNDAQTFGPEHLEALTLGWKGRLPGDRLRFDLEAFHWRYEDQQVSTIMRDSQGATNLGTRNVGNATMDGIEAAAEWLVADATRLRLDAQYLDATYDDFRYAVPGPAPPVTGCDLAPDGANFQVDCSGKHAPYAPSWSANLAAEQSFALAGGSRVVAEARLHYQSETLTGLDFTPSEYQRAYASWGAALTYAPANERYYVTAWGDNLTDRAVVANTLQHPFGSFVVGTVRPPRQYGLRVGARF
jgi:iron complex outermembrane receptor protein